MTARIALTAAELRIVRAVLDAELPPTARIWVYGSRATGRARRFSDLDLAIDAGRALTLDETARLREAFTESDLPFRVDVLDWQETDPRFLDLIRHDFVPVIRDGISAD